MPITLLYVEENPENKTPVQRVLGYKGDAEKALEAGCTVYRSKPVNIPEQWARVKAFVPGTVS